MLAIKRPAAPRRGALAKNVVQIAKKVLHFYFCGDIIRILKLNSASPHIKIFWL